MRLYSIAAFSAVLLVNGVDAFPEYRSLGGMSQRDLDQVIPTLVYRRAEPPPGPLAFNGTKIVNTPANPYIPPGPGDIRGPCPGLNTLANHNYIPHNGIATPAQIVTAVQEGFNMANDAALFNVYAAFLLDGNPITNLLSIGGKTPLTGADPPSPAIVGGLDSHNFCEGDSSMTRNDAFSGDNHTFNQTLFDQFVDFSNRFGGGKYNLTVAGELRFQRFQDSIATNPEFSFVSPRCVTAYGDAVNVINFFVDGRQGDGQLDMDSALGFFRDGRMPTGFFRANSPKSSEGIEVVFAAHLVPPGGNAGGLVNNYVPDPTSPTLADLCAVYDDTVNRLVKSLYPNPTGILRDALNANLNFFIQGVNGLSATPCTQVFPFGKD